jgi:hypothetical protein
VGVTKVVVVVATRRPSDGAQDAGAATEASLGHGGDAIGNFTGLKERTGMTFRALLPPRIKA